MLFVLSKILFFLLSPGWWVIILLLIGYRRRNKSYGKKFYFAALIIFLLFSNRFLYHKVCYAWQVNETNMQPNTKYTAILLGGSLHFDRNGKTNFNPSSDRFIQTLKLYNTGKLSGIIITGGTAKLAGSKYREAIALKNEFVLNGVPDSLITTETESRNTKENARFTKKIIDSLRLPPPFLLITSAVHMRRSAMIFEKEGFKAAHYPSAFDVGNEEFEWLDIIPSFDVLGNWENVIKEPVGYVVDKYIRR